MAKKENTTENQERSQRRLDTSQVAQRLNISRRSVYRLIHSGEIKAAAFGPVRGYQVWESSVEDYERRKEEEFQTEE